MVQTYRGRSRQPTLCYMTMHVMPPAAALLSYADAATYLGTSERHVRELWARREIAAVKVGRLVRFRRSDLDEYIGRHRVEAVR